MKYIDFDGVILDTENGLFDEYHRLKLDNPLLTKKYYLQNIDWPMWIKKAKVLNDSINILKAYDYNSACILTKINSLNEGIAKINYLREVNVKNNVILVPYDLEKSQVVVAKNNILVDDYKKNLINWQENGGISIHYSLDEEKMFKTIYNLDYVMDDNKLKRLIKR